MFSISTWSDGDGAVFFQLDIPVLRALVVKSVTPAKFNCGAMRQIITGVVNGDSGTVLRCVGIVPLWVKTIGLVEDISCSDVTRILTCEVDRTRRGLC